jgi:parvulin-like peptidyl-prolyl isomerase
MDKDKLKIIVENLKDLLSQLDLADIDDKDLFHEAINIFIHENISEEKKQAKQESNSEPLTLKQKNYLLSQGITIPSGMTKGEATQLISEIIERNNKSRKGEEYPDNF